VYCTSARYASDYGVRPAIEILKSDILHWE
jgi:hypothetical protein